MFQQMPPLLIDKRVKGLIGLCIFTLVLCNYKVMQRKCMFTKKYATIDMQYFRLISI